MLGSALERFIMKINNSTDPFMTSSRVESVISDVAYYTFPGTTHTVCCLTLKNGTTVVGESKFSKYENYKKDLGDLVAMNDAKRTVWGLEEYLLKEENHETS